MPTYKIAHILVGNVQFVIFPVSGSFTVRTPKEQEAMAKVFRDRAKAAGLVGDEHIVAEIGEVLAGDVVGRQTEEEVTVYKSLGHVVQDLACGWWLCGDGG